MLNKLTLIQNNSRISGSKRRYKSVSNHYEQQTPPHMGQTCQGKPSVLFFLQKSHQLGRKSGKGGQSPQKSRPDQKPLGLAQGDLRYKGQKKPHQKSPQAVCQKGPKREMGPEEVEFLSQKPAQNGPEEGSNPNVKSKMEIQNA